MSSNSIHYLSFFLGAGAIALQLLTVGVLFLLFFNSEKNKFLDFIKKHFLIIGFLLSLFATLFSLVYSEVIHFVPCQLCWFQRIFIFPQVFLFGVALWDKDKNVLRYSVPLLCVGFAIAVYQNFIYYFGNPVGACDSSGISCFQHLISEFGGYISIPMLSLTSFFVLLVLVLVAHFYDKNSL
jgi:disulfide bond formation protein DsbB